MKNKVIALIFIILFILAILYEIDKNDSEVIQNVDSCLTLDSYYLDNAPSYYPTYSSHTEIAVTNNETNIYKKYGFSTSSTYTYQTYDYTKAKIKTLGVIVPTDKTTHYKGLINSIEKAAEAVGINVEIRESDYSEDNQSRYVSEFIRERVSVIAIAPIREEDLHIDIRRIKEANIPIINIDKSVDIIVRDMIDKFIIINEKKYGTYVADMIVEALDNQHGTVLVLESEIQNQSEGMSDSTASFLKVLSKYDKTYNTEIKPATTEWTRLREYIKELSINGEGVSGIYSEDTEVLLKCAEIINILGLTDKIKVVGGYGQAKVFEYISNGLIYGTVRLDEEEQGALCIKVSQDIINNKSSEFIYMVDISKVTSKNIESIR